MSVAKLFADMLSQENERLRAAIYDISHHIGGSPGLPQTVVEAAESIRERLNTYQGHTGIPRDAHGRSVPFSVVGR